MAKTQENAGPDAQKTSDLTDTKTAMKTAPASVKVAEKREVILNPTKMKPAEYHRTTYQAIVPPDVVKDDLMKPEFWSHVAATLKTGDRIDILCQDGSYFAEPLVCNADRTWAKVYMLSYHDLTKVTLDISEDILNNYEVRFRGPKAWSVIRKDDNSVLQEGLHSEEDGHLWLKLHLKQRVAA